VVTPAWFGSVLGGGRHRAVPAFQRQPHRLIQGRPLRPGPREAPRRHIVSSVPRAGLDPTQCLLGLDRLEVSFSRAAELIAVIVWGLMNAYSENRFVHLQP
jgi:hypothetical protein